jgi:hypothetical protein
MTTASDLQHLEDMLTQIDSIEDLMETLTRQVRAMRGRIQEEANPPPPRKLWPEGTVYEEDGSVTLNDGVFDETPMTNLIAESLKQAGTDPETIMDYPNVYNRFTVPVGSRKIMFAPVRSCDGERFINSDTRSSFWVCQRIGCGNGWSEGRETPQCEAPVPEEEWKDITDQVRHLTFSMPQSIEDEGARK